jgi:hypothetical protein
MLCALLDTIGSLAILASLAVHIRGPRRPTPGRER